MLVDMWYVNYDWFLNGILVRQQYFTAQDWAWLPPDVREVFSNEGTLSSKCI